MDPPTTPGHRPNPHQLLPPPRIATPPTRRRRLEAVSDQRQTAEPSAPEPSQDERPRQPGSCSNPCGTRGDATNQPPPRPTPIRIPRTQPACADTDHRRLPASRDPADLDTSACDRPRGDDLQPPVDPEDFERRVRPHDSRRPAPDIRRHPISRDRRTIRRPKHHHRLRHRPTRRSSRRVRRTASGRRRHQSNHSAPRPRHRRLAAAPNPNRLSRRAAADPQSNPAGPHHPTTKRS